MLLVKSTQFPYSFINYVEFATYIYKGKFQLDLTKTRCRQDIVTNLTPKFSSRKLNSCYPFKSLITIELYPPTTVGSKSTKTARGTCFPEPVSLKNVLKESSPPPIVLSDGICPSG